MSNYKKSLIQDDITCCFFCKSVPVACHHIYHNMFRNASTKYDCIVWLCPNCHTNGKHAVHKDAERDLYLKRICQEKFEEIYSHELFMKTFKKNYL